MFKAGTTTPKLGEIRYGLVEGSNNTHRYVGIRPYLIVSNDKYNEFSGQAEVIPFTTKRMGSHNPVHIDYKAGEVDGLYKDSTLVIEGRDTLRNDHLSDPVGVFTKDNWIPVVNAMVVQCPMLALADLRHTRHYDVVS